jgi:hypothetical protein
VRLEFYTNWRHSGHDFTHAESSSLSPAFILALACCEPANLTRGLPRCDGETLYPPIFVFTPRNVSKALFQNAEPPLANSPKRMHQ